MAAKQYSGLPDDCAAQTLNNYCSSGLSAIGHGVAMVASGQEDRVLAGGIEMMSRVPFLSDRADFYTDTALVPRRRFIPPVLAADRLAHVRGTLADNATNEAFDNLWLGSVAVKTSSSYWSTAVNGVADHSAGAMHSALDAYNNTGIINGVEFCCDRDNADAMFALQQIA